MARLLLVALVAVQVTIMLNIMRLGLLVTHHQLARPKVMLAGQ
tara:strand:- start:297 stop:425 length:129 start_codon:yes stop_codon:yes gene_type:complete